MRASTPLPCPHGACSPDRPRPLHRHGPTHTVSTPEHAAASHVPASPWKARSRKMVRRRVRGMGARHQVSTPPGRRPPPHPHPRLHPHPCPCPRARPRHRHDRGTGCGHAHAAGHDSQTGRLMTVRMKPHCLRPHHYWRPGTETAWGRVRTLIRVPSHSCPHARKQTQMPGMRVLAPVRGLHASARPGFRRHGWRTMPALVRVWA